MKRATSTTRARDGSIDLPREDLAIDRLSEVERKAIAAHWLHRARAELSVAISFRLLRPRLKDVGAADVVLMLADKAIEDEQRHGELCARLAARYLGSDDISMPTPRDGTLPDFGTNDEVMETALLTIGMCCINESIASEWIRSCWQIATAPTALVANKAHLQDEIDHARLGWAHLASSAVSATLKRRLAPWIPRVLEVNVAQWKTPDEHLPVDGIPAHGHLSLRDNADVIDAAVRDVVLPGLAHVGLIQRPA